MITTALSAKSVGPGEVVYPDPGDFILTHTNHFTNRAIRFGQGIRYRGDRRKFAFWNHAALVVDSEGNIVEALGKGVQHNHISKYKVTEYTIVKPKTTPTDVKQMIDFAMWTVGQQYGFLTIFNLILWTFFGGKFNFGLDGTEICSGLVARSLERAGYIFERDPSNVMPADLACQFQVPLLVH